MISGYSLGVTLSSEVIDKQVVSTEEPVSTHFSSCEGVHDDMGLGSPLGGSIQDGGAMPVSTPGELTDVLYSPHMNQVGRSNSMVTSPQDGLDGLGCLGEFSGS